MNTSALFRFSCSVLFVACLGTHARADTEVSRRLTTLEDPAPKRSDEPAAEEIAARGRLDSGRESAEPVRKEERRSEDERRRRRDAARDVTLMMLGITRSSARGR